MLTVAPHRVSDKSVHAIRALAEAYPSLAGTVLVDRLDLPHRQVDMERLDRVATRLWVAGLVTMAVYAVIGVACSL